MSIFLTALCFAIGPSAPQQQGPSLEWVVDDVIPPLQMKASEETYLGGAMPVGDPAGMGRVAFQIQGSSSDGRGGSVAFGAALYAGRDDVRLFHLQEVLGRIDLSPVQCYLRTPTSIQVLARDAGANYGHAAFDAFTSRPRGVSIPHWINGALVNAGDLNGDGWEDAFYQRTESGIATCGALDGRTLNELWERQESFYGGYSVLGKYTERVACPDIDADGLADFIVKWSTTDPVTGDDLHDVRALSGWDGSLLWSHRGPGGVWMTVGADINGDGVGDVAVVKSDQFEILNGTTGTPLWQRDEQMLLPYIPEDHGYLGIRQPTLQNGASGTGHHLTSIIVTFSRIRGEERRRFVHLDALSGALVAVVAPPDDLEPWSSDVLVQHNTMQQFMYELGDVDGDGLDEYAWQVPAADYEIPGNTAVPMQLAILGLRTLWVPEQARAGERATARVAIPAAPGHEVYLALSREFLPQGGGLVDHWDTNLGPGRLLEATSGHRPFTTTLNADGQGRIDFRIPDHPLLPGETIYARAIVLEPGTTDQVKTISTLGEIEILP